jgi:hypothetical protein
MKYLITFLLFSTLPLSAQVTIVSTSPTNNATNVPVSTILSITFNKAVDTTGLKGQDWVFSNIDSGDVYFSPDATILYATPQLDIDKAYFVAVLFARGQDGSTLTIPQVFYFTTGSAFPPTTVSGTVSSGATGVSPENAIVALSAASLETQNEGPPPFAAWANVNSDGTFTIPYVVNGTYWPIAVKDVNNDGSLNGNYPDVFAFGDSIVVTGNVTGLTLTFERPEPISYASAYHQADSIKTANLPSDCVLRQASAYSVDTSGTVMDWQFYYAQTSVRKVYVVHVGFGEHSSMEVDDTNYAQWLYDHFKVNANAGQAAELTTVIPAVENGGGKAFRTQANAANYDFQIEAFLSDQTWSQFSDLVPDTAKWYWGVTYSFGYEDENNYWHTMKEYRYLCDFSTGALIGSATDVKGISKTVPEEFALEQNYPNPFNPSTTIRYSIPTRSRVRLAVFNLLGQQVAELANEEMSAGSFERVWNANVASGLYFYRIEAVSMADPGKRFVDVKKMVLVR